MCFSSRLSSTLENWSILSAVLPSYMFFLEHPHDRAVISTAAKQNITVLLYIYFPFRDLLHPQNDPLFLTSSFLS
jgi:hypothetical protein